MRWALAWCLFLTVATLAVLGTRGKVVDRRPLMFVSDMDDQPRYGPQAESPFFKDGRAMRQPPAGTVAYGGGDYRSDAGSPVQNADLLQADDRFYRGRQGDHWAPRNPVPIDLAALRRGRDRYNIFCAVCHGLAGYGDGPAARAGMPRVASFHDDRLRAMADGEIFNTITNGKGLMMAYGPKVAPRDRWMIVAYLRALQRSQNASPGDAPADVRMEPTQ